jgi:hypothetical protein
MACGAFPAWQCTSWTPVTIEGVLGSANHAVQPELISADGCRKLMAGVERPSIRPSQQVRCREVPDGAEPRGVADQWNNPHFGESMWCRSSNSCFQSHLFDAASPGSPLRPGMRLRSAHLHRVHRAGFQSDEAEGSLPGNYLPWLQREVPWDRRRRKHPAALANQAQRSAARLIVTWCPPSPGPVTGRKNFDCAGGTKWAL